MDSVENTIRKPFIDHIRELQIRLVWCAAFIILGSVAGYLIHEQLLAIVQKPLGETLYYTSPAGGFSFVFKLSLVFGFVIALPVVVFHLLGFTGPVLGKKHRAAILKYALWSVILAGCGVLFGYFVSLPAALHFLTNFGGQQIESLITADEYFNFALAYIGGFAMLFQLPLIILFINRVKPLKPGGMMKAQRYVILISFITAAILTPTPDPLNQSIMALPVILLYQLSILLVLIVNRRTRRKVRKASVNMHTKTVRPTRHLAKPALSLVRVERVVDGPSVIARPAPRLIDMVVR